MIELPKVLVFTVTYSGKDYIWNEFQKAAKLIDYPNYKHIIVDNTNDEGQYASHLRSYGFEVIKIQRGNNTREAITRAQETARKIAVDEGYDYQIGRAHV